MTLTSIENLSIRNKENVGSSAKEMVKQSSKDITSSDMKVDFSQEPLLKDNPNR